MLTAKAYRGLVLASAMALSTPVYSQHRKSIDIPFEYAFVRLTDDATYYDFKFNGPGLDMVRISKIEKVRKGRKQLPQRMLLANDVDPAMPEVRLCILPNEKVELVSRDSEEFRKYEQSFNVQNAKNKQD